VGIYVRNEATLKEECTVLALFQAHRCRITVNSRRKGSKRMEVVKRMMQLEQKNDFFS
jgi:hypothetical protein